MVMSDMESLHEETVLALAKPGEDILSSLDPEKCHLLHMAVGVAGEAGELLDAIKKYVIYEKQLDLDNIIEELGDLEFYMRGIRTQLGISRDAVLRDNMVKLSMRYGDIYSNQAAQQRADKEGE